MGLVSRPQEILKTIGGLGIAPNDRQLSTVCNYLPSRHGWIVTDKKVFWGGNLGTPHNVPYSHGLGNATTTAAAAVSPTEALLQNLVAEEKKKTKFAMISAGAVGIVALLAVVNHFRS
jgi:hypothetical protein